MLASNPTNPRHCRGNLTGVDSCAAGYTAALCGRCDEAYFRDVVTSTCERCNGADGATIFTVSLIVCVVALLLYPLYLLIMAVSKRVKDFVERHDESISLIRENATTYFISVTDT